MNIPRLLFYPLFVIGILLPSLCFSQGKAIEMNDSTSLRAELVFMGDIVSIGYDSAYLLNKKIFRIYSDNYERVRKGNTSSQKLITEYERMISLQDSMLKAKEAYYQNLKSNFDAFASTSNKFADRTDMNINVINTSLNTATSQLNNIKSLLDDSMNKLKSQNRQKLKYAIGGFTIGLGAAAIVFLITK